jgi:hypothetical protein
LIFVGDIFGGLSTLDVSAVGHLTAAATAAPSTPATPSTPLPKSVITKTFTTETVAEVFVITASSYATCPTARPIR